MLKCSQMVRNAGCASYLGGEGGGGLGGGGLAGGGLHGMTSTSADIWHRQC